MTRSPSQNGSTPASAPASCRGQHLICEFFGASELDDVDTVRRVLERAAEHCGATILESRLHPFEEHGGVTGVVLLAESHITIHTWPEHDYAAVDLFMCGSCDPEEGVPVLEEAFSPETVQQACFERGRPSSSAH